MKQMDREEGVRRNRKLRKEWARFGGVTGRWLVHVGFVAQNPGPGSWGPPNFELIDGPRGCLVVWVPEH